MHLYCIIHKQEIIIQMHIGRQSRVKFIIIIIIKSLSYEYIQIEQSAQFSLFSKPRTEYCYIQNTKCVFLLKVET